MPSPAASVQTRNCAPPSSAGLRKNSTCVLALGVVHAAVDWATWPVKPDPSSRRTRKSSVSRCSVKMISFSSRELGSPQHLAQLARTWIRRRASCTCFARSRSCSTCSRSATARPATTATTPRAASSSATSFSSVRPRPLPRRAVSRRRRPRRSIQLPLHAPELLDGQLARPESSSISLSSFSIRRSKDRSRA